MPFGDVIFSLLAQAAAPAAEPPGEIRSRGLLSTLAPAHFPIIPFLYYFLILRPQQAQERKKEETRSTPSRRTTAC